MKKILPVLVVLLSWVMITYGQEQKVKPDQSKIAGSAKKSEIFTTPCMGFVNTPSTDLKWRPILSKKIQSFEPKAPDQERIEKLKAEKLLLKKQSSNNGNKGEKSTLSVTPQVGINYLGNENSGSSPLDNTIAISNGGWIVSLANTTIEYDNSSGSTVYYNDLVTFINDGNISAVCDPVVIYDPAADRFIFFCQTMPISSNSKILIFFSKSNDPNDGWWTYQLTGNPLNNSEGFDYPKLAVSNNELYITGNLFFDPGGNFDQSILYQINKTNGYAGNNLSWQYWYNIDGPPFTLMPVSHGQGGNYGPGCYLVSTDAGGSSNIKVYDLTDNLTGSPSLNLYNVSTTEYSPASNSEQSGTSCLLDNGDCRALSGFYMNGIIHFVFHSDIGSGWNGINYNRITVSSMTNQSGTFGNVGNYDYSYPSVASFANNTSDKSVMINFGRASSSIYPEVRVVNCDDGMNWSASTLVKSSDSYVSYTSSTSERWGDYTGISRKHNSSSPRVWMCGSWGTSANKWSAWNAEIYGGPAGIETSQGKTDFKVFPNPVVETFNVEFSLDENTPIVIDIVDVNGSIIKELYKGGAQQGDNVFSFNKANLTSGIYFLRIKNNENILKNEKIIITD